ncbi:hypothetical protein [Candidatus Clostridium radicumherbarum]|uniref:Lipoprotein n=1 Tax=Candidatus Clostridium radicumherbarum TaxID=3381662 RepID=A0ABW8TYD5_9CLOT
MKKRLLAYIAIMLMISSACGSVEKTSPPRTSNTSNNSIENVAVSPGVDTSQANTSSEPKPETDKSIIPNNTSEPFVGRINLDSETEKSFYGTWKVEKLLGFANSYNDASEYPTGQKIIGDEIIIKKDFYSTKGLKNYNVFQFELKNPLYNIIAICYSRDSFYSLFKINLPSLNINDKVKYIVISDSSTKLGIPGSFFIVNNDRLILLLEATCFELKKISD